MVKQDILKKRYIGQNIHILEDVTFFTKMQKTPRIILSIDFEKYFDSVKT